MVVVSAASQSQCVGVFDAGEKTTLQFPAKIGSLFFSPRWSHLNQIVATNSWCTKVDLSMNNTV